MRACSGDSREPHPTLVTCPACGGQPPRTPTCRDCRRHGLRRAQLVLTVANMDTGAVTSADIGPGVIAAADIGPGVIAAADIGPGVRDADPARPGRRFADLTPRVRQLAAAVGAHVESPELLVELPTSWRPDLPGPRRRELAALALARYDHDPWRVWIGRGTPPSTVDPADRLARLCALADLLLLDLVIEHRWSAGRPAWDIRYELPGTPVPGQPERRWPDLDTALTRTTARTALDGLGWRCRTAPAHLLRPTARRPPAVGDLTDLARALRANTTTNTYTHTAADDANIPAVGAQAIWRDGRWWHTRLRPDDRPVPAGGDAGQAGRRIGTPVRRVIEPPAPSWRGEPIPARPCPDCVTTGRLRACPCTAGRHGADPTCAFCGGVGFRTSTLPCTTCGDRRRIHAAVQITVTDLDTRVTHLTWRASDHAPVAPARTGSVVQLPGPFRLADQAARFGVRPEELTEADSGHPLGRDLREGWIVQPRPDVDPVTERVTAAGAGLPGARLLVAAVRPEAPPLTELIRLALGLSLALVVAVRDDSAAVPPAEGGWCWSVELVRASALVDEPVYHPTPVAAVAALVDYLDGALAETVPDAPGQALPRPSSAARPLAVDPVPALARLARRHPGETVTVRFSRAGRDLRVAHRDGTSSTLPADLLDGDGDAG
ncbi:hypothetical protein [Plantactinospora sp. GCM10030261]|uniref:hypothetical protein n=1 Tax=Plantactinospora sp. GCM10030261 TaxID=3273420 RepID=UPI00361273A0